MSNQKNRSAASNRNANNAAPATPTAEVATSRSNKDHIKCPTFTGENFPIWQRKLKKEYASSSILAIFRMWCRWEDIQYNNNLDKYIAEMEAVLAKFAAMGLDLPPQILSCAIIARISKKRPTMMDV
ncbi:hypothetical protein PCANC_07063 [Puccinia coronata f. sp. avenae]|uniref:DUF4219 domain-containing protein n=1 Tax=Puccinia coronata f. sp. avenae TaxID=200324 RepID=A0A2N5VZL4_9BASI|nr:hypothetical protein PCANC_07063 [Puccinia coronata f. sp. avenae]